MKSEYLAHFPWPWLTCVGLLIFMAEFAGAVAWVFRRDSRKFYAELAQAPLREGEE